MRGVADQRQPLADERACDKISERKGPRLIQRLDLAEMQAKALFQFAVKFIRAKRDDACRLGALLGPYQRRALPVSGRMANGPAGRKCSSARPR